MFDTDSQTDLGTAGPLAAPAQTANDVDSPVLVVSKHVDCSPTGKPKATPAAGVAMILIGASEMPSIRTKIQGCRRVG